MRQLAQLADRGVQLGVRAIEPLLESRVRSAAARTEHPQRQCDGHEPLLSAVVQVTFETPPLDVAGRDDPDPRGAQRLQLGPDLRVKALVLERQPCTRDDLLDEIRIAQTAGVVHERRHRLARPQERRHGPARPRRDVDRMTVGVDVVIDAGLRKASRRPGSPSSPASTSRVPPGPYDCASSTTSRATEARDRRAL